MEKDREEFERWAKEKDRFSPGTCDGKYLDAFTDAAYRAWQARQPEIDAVKADNERLLQSLAGVDFQAAPTPPAQDESFQARVQPWLLECFGPMIAGDKEERNHRFLEEALELVQACGCTQDESQQLVDYVYNRPAGDKQQEVGGVMVTLAALCLAHEMDMHQTGEVELARIWTKVEQIRTKQAAKPKHSPLPVAPTPPAQEDEPYGYLYENDRGTPVFDYARSEWDAERSAEVKLYTRPDNSGLKKAAEEFLRASLLADHRFLSDEHDRDHALAVKNLRAALEGK